jgi:hypothetical protein
MSAGIAVADFRMGSPSLEEVFFALTGGKAAFEKVEGDNR